MLLFLMKLPVITDVDMELQNSLIDIDTCTFTQITSNIRNNSGIPFDSA